MIDLVLQGILNDCTTAMTMLLAAKKSNQTGTILELRFNSTYCRKSKYFHSKCVGAHSNQEIHFYTGTKFDPVNIVLNSKRLCTAKMIFKIPFPIHTS